ncbi:unnamed protein product [Lymnaea stagnalis]|uniref:BTB domain-containing protein n=1 Tax=Lymnaea stagnalis TaxID=6523 RepID=A0AAV2HK58_LYMST
MPYKPKLAALVLQSLGKLQMTDEKLSDLQIRIDNRKFHCHRFHMCACSEFFHILLRTATEKGDTMPVVILTIKGIEPDTFENILGSIYRAENNLTEQNMIDLWHAVSDLQINFLVSECEEFIMNKISLSNYLNIYESAVLLKSERVLKSIYPFLVKHYRDFIRSQTFVAMSLESFEQLLSECGSAIQPPDLLVESIIKWVSHVPETIPGQENGTDLQRETDNASEDDEYMDTYGKSFDSKEMGKQKPLEAIFVRQHGQDGLKLPETDSATRINHVGRLLKEADLDLVTKECLKMLLDNAIVMETRNAREFVHMAVSKRINEPFVENPPGDNAYHKKCLIM